MPGHRLSHTAGTPDEAFMALRDTLPKWLPEGITPDAVQEVIDRLDIPDDSDKETLVQLGQQVAEWRHSQPELSLASLNDTRKKVAAHGAPSPGARLAMASQWIDMASNLRDFTGDKQKFLKETQKALYFPGISQPSDSLFSSRDRSVLFDILLRQLPEDTFGSKHTQQDIISMAKELGQRSGSSAERFKLLSSLMEVMHQLPSARVSGKDDLQGSVSHAFSETMERSTYRLTHEQMGSLMTQLLDHHDGLSSSRRAAKGSRSARTHEGAKVTAIKGALSLGISPAYGAIKGQKSSQQETIGKISGNFFWARDWAHALDHKTETPDAKREILFPICHRIWSEFPAEGSKYQMRLRKRAIETLGTQGLPFGLSGKDGEIQDILKKHWGETPVQRADAARALLTAYDNRTMPRDLMNERLQVARHLHHLLRDEQVRQALSPEELTHAEREIDKVFTEENAFLITEVQGWPPIFNEMLLDLKPDDPLKQKILKERVLKQLPLKGSVYEHDFPLINRHYGAMSPEDQRIVQQYLRHNLVKSYPRFGSGQEGRRDNLISAVFRKATVVSHADLAESVLANLQDTWEFTKGMKTKSREKFQNKLLKDLLGPVPHAEPVGRKVAIDFVTTMSPDDAKFNLAASHLLVACARSEPPFDVDVLMRKIKQPDLTGEDASAIVTLVLGALPSPPGWLMAEFKGLEQEKKLTSAAMDKLKEKRLNAVGAYFDSVVPEGEGQPANPFGD